MEQAIYLHGDSFPMGQHVEDALRERLAPWFREWVGQGDVLSRTGQTDYSVDIPTRLTLVNAVARPRAVLFGRSSGARVATLAASRRSDLTAVVCLGYPFRAPGRVLEPARFAHLAQLSIPTLIVQGRADRYGGSDLTTLYALSASITVVLVDSDHVFQISPPVWDEIAATMLEFCRRAWERLPQEPQAFDEDFYLRIHPDVAKAVAEGRLPSGYEHFCRCGRREGRRFRIP
jgi:pimeloyl-ACP methyl ester carboxylesterase